MNRETLRDVEALKRALADDPSLLYQRVKPGLTLLHQAVLYDQSDVVHALVELGANPHARDGRGMTPLHLASAQGCLGALAALLEHAQDLTVKTARGETSLHLAVWPGPEYDEVPGHTKDARETVRTLLQAGAPVNEPDEQGQTALWIAAPRAFENHDCSVVQLLLQAGAKTNLVDKRGDTPLHRLADLPNVELFTLLLEHGADPTLIDAQGRTVLDVLRPWESWGCSTPSDHRDYKAVRRLLTDHP